MAVYFEKYDPWREQLAGSILAPLLKAAMGRWQEAEQNRKENAFIGEAMKEFQPQVDTSMPTLQGFQGPRPSSPWEQAAANARRMQDFFAQFEGKQTPFERLLLMEQGAGMKYLPDNAPSNYVDLYKHQTPHQDFKLVDSGDKVTGYAFNPANGAVSEVLSQVVGMSPSQAGSLANERSRIGISAGNLGLAREKWEWEKTHGGAGGSAGGAPYQFLQDSEGNFVRANKRTGELDPTDVGGLVKSSAYQRMPEKDKIQLQSLMRQKEGIIRDAAFVGYGPSTQATLDDIEQKIQRLLPDEGGQPVPQQGNKGQKNRMRYDTVTGTFSF